MSRPRLIACLVTLLLALVTFAIFWPVSHYPFTSFDDNDYVTHNEVVQQGLTGSGVHWAFTTGKTGNWIPLVWLSHMAVCQWFGLNPEAHHLTNVLFHVANTTLLLILLWRLTAAFWPCVFATALFAWHPLHVESVAWIAERKDMLSTFFGLLALLAYTHYVQSKSTERPKNALQSPSYWLALLGFAFSLMSKPMLVTLPCVMLLLDLWPLKRFSLEDLRLTVLKPLVAEKIPFFIFSVALSPITYYAQRAGGYVTSLDAIPWRDRLENIPLAYSRYLLQMVWPKDLVVFYPFPMAISWILVAATILFLALISAVVWRSRQRAPYWLLGWLWFLGTLVPVIGLVTFGGQAMANRFSYFTLIGIFLAVALSFKDLATRLRLPVAVTSTLAGAVLAACVFQTENQLGYWRDDVALFSHAIDHTRDYRWIHFRDFGILQNRLGLVLDKAGQPDEAIAHYRAAIELRPYYYEAHYNLGVALNEKGEAGEAYEHFQDVLKLKPDDINAEYASGIILAGKGQLDEAQSLFQKILKQNPDFAGAYYQAGLIAGKRGQLDEAMAQYREALKRNPNLVEAHNSLGVALARQGQLDEAMSHFQSALTTDPNNIGAMYNLGLVLNGKGQFDDAVTMFQKVIERTPKNPDAHNNLGLALMRKGRLDDAINQFQTTLNLNPNHMRARKNLEAALQAKGGPMFPAAPNP